MFEALGYKQRVLKDTICYVYKIYPKFRIYVQKGYPSFYPSRAETSIGIQEIQAITQQMKELGTI